MTDPRGFGLRPRPDFDSMRPLGSSLGLSCSFGQWKRKRRFLRYVGAPKPLVESTDQLLQTAAYLEATDIRLDDQGELIQDLASEIEQLVESVDEILHHQADTDNTRPAAASKMR